MCHHAQQQLVWFFRHWCWSPHHISFKHQSHTPSIYQFVDLGLFFLIIFLVNSSRIHTMHFDHLSQPPTLSKLSSTSLITQLHGLSPPFLKTIWSPVVLTNYSQGWGLPRVWCGRYTRYHNTPQLGSRTSWPPSPLPCGDFVQLICAVTVPESSYVHLPYCSQNKVFPWSHPPTSDS